MKKIILVLLTMLFVSGCSKEITCTYEGEGYVSEVSVKYKNNKVIDAVNVITYESKDEATEMCEIFELLSDAEGNLECDDEEIIMNNYHTSLSENEMTINELIDHMEENSYTCK